MKNSRLLAGSLCCLMLAPAAQAMVAAPLDGGPSMGNGSTNFNCNPGGGGGGGGGGGHS